MPAGYEFLPVILQAIRQTRTITMGYQKFGCEPYTKLVDPYAVKLFRQRWYMLADNHERMSVYSLDRMFSAKITDTRFRRSASFSPAGYFAEYFGTMTDGTPMEHVVLKAYGKMANLIRTLPLHASQQEHESGDGSRHPTDHRLRQRTDVEGRRSRRAGPSDPEGPYPPDHEIRPRKKSRIGNVKMSKKVK